MVEFISRMEHQKLTNSVSTFDPAASFSTSFGYSPLMLLPALLTLFPASVHAAGEQQWVKASWVDVRIVPAKDAKIIANLATNTAVSVEQRKDEWCLVSATTTGLEPLLKPAKGYIACNTLGTKKLTLGDVFAPGKDGTTAPDMEKQLFWIAPSLGRFTQVGTHLNYRSLSAEQSHREKTTRTPVRFEIPEFEAMKKRLMQGVVPLAEQELSRVNVNTFKAFNSIPAWYINSELINHVKTFEPQKNLPPAKSSLFKRHADVLLSGEGNADAIATMLGQPNSVKFSGKPEWITGHHDEGVSAFWDIRKIDVKYANPVALHSISHTGFVSARMIQSNVIMANSAAEGCAEGYPVLPEGQAVPGYPRSKEYPLVSFFVPRLLAIKKSDVFSRKAPVVVHSDPYSGPKNPQSRSILIHTLDLDQDGVPDLAIMEWSSPGFVSGSMSSQRYQFVNIAGDWWFAGYESYGECT